VTDLRGAGKALSIEKKDAAALTALRAMIDETNG